METAKSLQFPQQAVWEASRVVEEPRDVVLAHYDREQLALRRYLVFLGMDVDSARETVQEAFLRLHEHLLANGDRTNLRAWLYRVAHNLARNAQSASHARRTEPLPESSGIADWPAGAVSVEQDLLAREQLSRLREGMNQLSSAQRECLLLRSQGFKYREIAEVLNLSVSTVAENVQRGLGKLKELL